MPDFKQTMQAPVENTIVMPDFKQTMQAPVENTIVMPDFKQTMQAPVENTIVMPDFKQTMQAPVENTIVMPDFKQTMQAPVENTIVMPEFKQTMQAPVENTIVMPEFKQTMQAPVENTIVMPDLSAAHIIKNEPVLLPNFSSMGDNQPVFNNENLPPFHFPPMAESTIKNEQMPIIQSMPSFRENITNEIAAPPQMSLPQNNPITDDKPDKLESNILMYMPHGAKVKKSIIESLVSKQYTQAVIKAKVQEMCSKKTLKSSIENGIEYLIRP
jgi:hypothetical protein